MNESALPLQPALNPRFRLQWEPVQNCHVLLYPEGMVKLNASAAEILKRCDGAHSVDAMVAELETAFGKTGLRDDIVQWLSVAQRNAWIR